MQYRFGAARRLYRDRVHPRVILGPSAVATLRARTQKGDGRKIAAALRKRVRVLVEAVLKSSDLPALLEWKCRLWNDPGILIRMGIEDIALVGLLDEAPDTIEAIRRVFDYLGSERAVQNKIAVSGVAFDLAYHFLSPESRRAYCRAGVAAIRSRLAETRKSIFKVSGSNILLGTALAGVSILLAIRDEPEVGSLDEELAELVKILEAVMHVAINADGYPEEDTGYGTGVAADLARDAEALRRAGIYDPYRQCPHYARFGRAILHFVQPWGENLANTGDHGADFQQREFILARLASETRDPSLLWLLGTLYYHHGMIHPQNRVPDYYMEVPLRKGFRTQATGQSLLMLPDMRRPKHPGQAGVPTAFRDRGRGLVSFRSSWKEDATFVVFDGCQRSPATPGHFHDSAGHFSISALGEYFAVDNGRYNNEQACHNVVLVDGKSGRPLDGRWECNYAFGLLTGYRPDDFCDRASVDSSHQHNCLWATRTLGLVKGEGAPAYVWTLDYVNKDNRGGEFWWTLNSSPENSITTHAGSATITGWRKGNHLDVHVLTPRQSYTPPHHLEFLQDTNFASAHGYLKTDLRKLAAEYPQPTDQLHGALYVRPRLIAKVTGVNGQILSFMLPRKAGQPSAKVQCLDGVDASLAAKITFEKTYDVLIWAFYHHLLEADDVKARGNWVLVRRSMKTGRVLHVAGSDLSSLEVAGEKIAIPPSARERAFNP